MPKGKFYAGIEEKANNVCYGFKIWNWNFSIKFPRVVSGYNAEEDEKNGTSRDAQWNFQPFRGQEVKRQVYLQGSKMKRKAESMADIFHGQRYRVVEEAEPLDSVSTSSDHIYAEIYEPFLDDPPVVPPRSDTPTVPSPPNYPPYSSCVATRKSRRKSLNIDGLPLLH